MRNIGLYILCPVLSFIAGIFSYMLILKWVWNETLGGDLAAILFYGGIIFLTICFPIYLGVIHLIDKWFHQYKGLLYPLGCMLVFFIPTLFLNLLFGSFDLLSPESMLFHSFFLTAGFIFGVCHWCLKHTFI